MQRTETKPESDGFSAAVETPDEWLSGDFDLYQQALVAAAAGGHELALCQLAGVIALARKGRVRIEVDGFDPRDDHADLSALNSRVMGFLRQHVALPLEETQTLPFGSSAPSVTGTRATRR